MAELVASAIAAEQVVSTSLEAGAAYAVAQPTQPLKASLRQFAASAAGDKATSLELARSHHTVTVMDGKAYIFGGELPGGRLCNTDVHAMSLQSDGGSGPDYACYPALPVKQNTTGELLVPARRSRHAACLRTKYIIIHGGSNEQGTPISEESCLWAWNSENLTWAKIHAATQISKTMEPRDSHGIFLDKEQDILILHGGRTGSGSEQSPSRETWLYDFNAVAWTELPSCPAASSAAALANGILYSISSDSAMGGSIHVLKLGRNATERAKPGALQWAKVDFPTNPLTPGPKPRVGSALLPITTGFGRWYLAYLFGSKDESGSQPLKALEKEKHPFYSDIWSLQLPSQGINPASVKDTIRDRLPGHIDSGAYSWAEVEVIPTEQADLKGKAHPGPRGFFGASASEDGKRIFVWGGVNAKNEKEADGWMLHLR